MCCKSKHLKKSASKVKLLGCGFFGSFVGLVSTKKFVSTHTLGFTPSVRLFVG